MMQQYESVPSKTPNLPNPIYYHAMYHLLNTEDSWQEFVNDWNDTLDYSQKDIDRFSPFLHNHHCFKNSKVLDLGCNLGYSLIFAKHLGADKVTGIEARNHWISAGQKVLDQYGDNDITLLNHDVNDLTYLTAQVCQHDMIVCMGLFYHLNNHVQFLETMISSPDVHTIMIESLLVNDFNHDKSPAVYFCTESVDNPLNAYSDSSTTAFVGAPNIRWFRKIFDIYGWKISAIHVTENPEWNPKRFCITAHKK